MYFLILKNWIFYLLYNRNKYTSHNFLFNKILFEKQNLKWLLIVKYRFCICITALLLDAVLKKESIYIFSGRFCLIFKLPCDDLGNFWSFNCVVLSFGINKGIKWLKLEVFILSNKTNCGMSCVFISGNIAGFSVQQKKQNLKAR